MEEQLIEHKLGFLQSELREEILQHGILQDIPAGTGILHPGQYVKVIPIVLEGLVRVYTTREDKELLLYYIKAAESCIMSFSAGIENSTSQIYADCIEDSQLLLLPVDRVQDWIVKYPSFSRLIYDQYHIRYLDLLHTVEEVLFDSLDTRLLKYLKGLSEIRGTNSIKVTHQQIANELGTAREVISRILKKLESEDLVTQSAGVITLTY